MKFLPELLQIAPEVLQQITIYWEPDGDTKHIQSIYMNCCEFFEIWVWK